MKSIISLALVLLIVSMQSQALAQNGKTKKGTQKVTQPQTKQYSKQAKLGTSFRFSGSSLRGKYQTSMGTAATVENDKLLDDLLNGRTQFEDRRQQEAGRN